ncbi:SurA N-terminal domain-containing protein [Sphingomonas rhizophila]|uniref:peptidylprolyl isomerase n=1 Tax=Sphingomonas rhizophila TaxID=2071607 RepID=A0A7G9SBV1_9SPHN|nr:peptidyl-prolyl cis-trans isomerase [Sphingomonas rhizophila]QNN65326.1 SurA N-terminal domain-containing protein [Sphingomonas rhizophila]
MRYSVLLLTAAAIVVSGCDRKAEGQTVAVVNGEEITSAELNAEISLANLPADVDKKAATARILQTMVDRRLLAQQAKADGLDKTPEFLTRQRRATEDLLIGMVAQRKLSSTKLPSPDEVTKLQQSQPEKFAKREILTLSQLEFPTQKDPAALQAIKDSHSLADLEAALKARGVEVRRGTRKISSADFPHDIYVRVSQLPPGEPFLIPVGNRSVANVITAREPAPLTDEQAKPVAVNVLRQQSGAKIMETMLKDLRTKAKIEYKEGFAPPAK